jgi:hypothetical protein
MSVMSLPLERAPKVPVFDLCVRAAPQDEQKLAPTGTDAPHVPQKDTVPSPIGIPNNSNDFSSRCGAFETTFEKNPLSYRKDPARRPRICLNYRTLLEKKCIFFKWSRMAYFRNLSLQEDVCVY